MASAETSEQLARARDRRDGRERRRHRRVEIPGAMVQFGYPAPLGRHCEQPLKDVSLGGLAFYFQQEGCLGRVHPGKVIHQVRLVSGDVTVHLDMLVVRVVQVDDGQWICGGFARWRTVEDFERVKEMLAAATGRPG